MNKQDKTGKTFLFEAESVSSTFYFLEELSKNVIDKKEKIEELLSDFDCRRIVWNKDVFVGGMEGFVLNNNYTKTNAIKPLKKLGSKGATINRSTDEGKELLRKIKEVGVVEKKYVTDFLETSPNDDFWIKRESENCFSVNFRKTVTIHSNDAKVLNFLEHSKLCKSRDKSNVIEILSNISPLDKKELGMRIELSQRFQDLVDKLGVEAVMREFDFSQEQFQKAMEGTHEYGFNLMVHLNFIDG